MKIKIINHLQGTSRGSSSSSRRTTITASADDTNNIAHTPRCVPRWDSDSDSIRLVARFVAEFVAGIVSEICLVLLQAPCTVDAYAVNESSRVREAAVTVNVRRVDASDSSALQCSVVQCCKVQCCAVTAGSMWINNFDSQKKKEKKTQCSGSLSLSLPFPFLLLIPLQKGRVPKRRYQL